jgi:MoaA/NifB/PqqE/SkfB family radical SAM enzyme
MPFNLFSTLVPFLKHTDLVYLQGWGEPLLHDNLFEMIRVCKAQGKRVGFTTNGMLLTEDTMQMAVELQLDILAVSFAGTTSATHNRIRKGTDFDRVVSQLEQLRQIKRDKRTEAPGVHVAYLMLKSNFDELNGIPQLAKKVGASQIVASNMSLIVDSPLAEEAIFHDTERTEYYRNMLEEIKRRAAREKIVFDYHGPGLNDTSCGCRENVRRACVINVEGEVVPCVFTNPVLCSHHIFKGQSIPTRAMTFGNIRHQNLTRIWNEREYTYFRNFFDPETARALKEIQEQLPQCCVKCYKNFGA